MFIFSPATIYEENVGVEAVGRLEDRRCCHLVKLHRVQSSMDIDGGVNTVVGEHEDAASFWSRREKHWLYPA